GLTARQIRYYENHQLIQPSRSKGNQRLFSFNDVDHLIEIKELIDKGLNLAGIKQVIQMNTVTEHQENKTNEKSPEISEKDLRKILQKELFVAGRLGKTTLRQGELSRFFH